MIRRPPRSARLPYTTLFRSVLAHALRGQRRGGDHALLLDLADALRHELGHDRRLVDLLHLAGRDLLGEARDALDRKSTRLNSSHANISYAVFCLKTQTSHSP